MATLSTLINNKAVEKKDNTCNWIIKSNILNEAYCTGMKAEHICLLATYLSKINPEDINSREVCFSVEEYEKILGVKRVRTDRLLVSADELLKLLVSVRNQVDEDGNTHSYRMNLFSKLEIIDGIDGKRTIKMKCSEDICPFLFGLRDHFVKFKLWNIVRLRNGYHMRLYELLKQYEKVGERTISLNELRLMLGIGENEYPIYNNFKVRVLDAGVREINDNTDIKIGYTPIFSYHGKVESIAFTIKSQDTSQTLCCFPADYDEPSPEELASDSRDSICLGFDDELFSEFSDAQLEELKSLAFPNITEAMISCHDAYISRNDARQYATSTYIRDKILHMNTRRSIKDRYGYLRNIVKNNY